MSGEVVDGQFGYFGLRLRSVLGWIGLFLVAILGAINNTSFYRGDGPEDPLVAIQRLLHVLFTPWNIIVGEFGIALALALLAGTLLRGSWRTAVIAGVGAGLSIFVCYTRWRFF